MKYCILFTVLSYINCWWEVGHMMTAQVAENELKAKRYDVYQWAQSLVQDFNHLTDGRSNTFVEAAVWADDIKESGTAYMNNWHFTDRPINPNGVLFQMDNETMYTTSVNGMDRAQKILTNKQTAKYRHTVFKAEMLRMILHMTGDIHQPLHNSNFYNQSYPYGDLGGNRLKIQLANGTFVNFHSFWDSGAFSLQPNDSFLQRPLTQDSLSYTKNWAADLIQKYPLSKYKDLDMTNPEVWTYVGFKQALNFAYPQIIEDNSYDQDYISQAARFCEENIVIGGYRLAAKLTEIYDIILDNESQLIEEIPKDQQ